MKRTIVIALLALLALLVPAPAHAKECIEKACIEVYTQDGKIVIEGRKGTGPVQKKSVTPAPAKSKKAVVPKNVAPIPKVTASAKPKAGAMFRPLLPRRFRLWAKLLRYR